MDHDEILIEDGSEDDLGLSLLDLGELSGKVGVARGVAFLSDHGAALFGVNGDKVILQALSVVVVDVVENRSLVIAEIVGDEGSGDTALNGVDEADAEVILLEHGGVVDDLHGDLLVGGHGGHIGDLVLVENGLDGDALTRGVRADDRADLILRAQALGNVDRLLRVALGVVADQLDLLAKQAAVGVEIVNEHLNRLALAGTESSLVAGQRAHPAELDDIVAVAASFVLRPAADEQCREHQTGQGESNELLHRFAHGLILLQIVVTNSLPEWSGLAGVDVRRAGSIPAFTPSLLMCMTRKSGK